LSPENISEAIRVVQPHAVDACSRLEFAPGRKDAERVREFRALKQRVVSKGWTVIKALRVGDGFRPESVAEYEAADAILLDAFAGEARGGTGRVFDWSMARRVGELVPKLFLAGGLSPENISEAIRVVQPHAVDACSRLEFAPGRKDAERVREFIKLAQTKAG
jgi:phosphoribosylanthranilate isomerase